jgi:hypothetical protein
MLEPRYSCAGASSAGAAPTAGRSQQAWTGEDYGRLSRLIVAVGSGLLQSILAVTYHAEARVALEGPRTPGNDVMSHELQHLGGISTQKMLNHHMEKYWDRVLRRRSEALPVLVPRMM